MPMYTIEMYRVEPTKFLQKTKHLQLDQLAYVVGYEGKPPNGFVFSSLLTLINSKPTKNDLLPMHQVHPPKFNIHITQPTIFERR